jgi:AcrR family transcriptional regulator
MLVKHIRMSRPNDPPALGRRPGTTQTRSAITHAAERRFLVHGYEGASLRSIARDAGVDPALITHFFGSKAGLFAAVVKWPLDPSEVTATVLAGERDDIGRRLAEMFIRHWGESERRSPIIALVSAATSDPAAALLLRTFLLDHLLLPVLDALDADQRPLRAGLISAQLTGLGLSRYVLGLVNPEEVSDEQIITALAPTLQRYCTQPLS